MRTDFAEASAPSLHAACRRHTEMCSGCRRPLPIHAPHVGEASALWECAACLTPVSGVLPPTTRPEMARLVRLAQTNFDARFAPPIPPILRQVIQEFSQRRMQKRARDDRRRNERAITPVDVALRRFDEQGSPMGKPFPGIVADLSAHGMGLVGPLGIEEAYVAIQMRDRNSLVQLLGQIVWSHPMGQGYYNAGVKFVMRFGQRMRVPEESLELVGAMAGD